MGSQTAFLPAVSFVDRRTAGAQPGRSRCRHWTPARREVVAVIGPDGTPMNKREAEIAAKIARLRRMNRLKSQRSGGTEDEDSKSSGEPPDNESAGRTGDGRSGPVAVPQGFSDLPDWKKEQVLLGEMRKAESFLGRSGGETPAAQGSPVDCTVADVSDATSEESGIGQEGEELGENAGTGVDEADDSDGYKPKVRTWGVFPRPDNISKAYGGGRPVPIGGRKMEEDPEAKKREEETKARLASYRKSRGIDLERERQYATEIDAAMVAAERAMCGAFAYEAVRELEAVKGYVSPMSQRGGEVYLALALGYEATGQREAAQKVYKQLRQSAFSTVARQARNLLAGFDAEEVLRIDGKGVSEGGKLRVGTFSLPDMAGYADKRYETVFFPKSEPDGSEEENTDDEDDTSSRDTTITLAALLCIAILPIVFLRALSH